MTKTILLIPDVHAMPGDSLRRLDNLKRFLIQRGSDIDGIVQIGDLWDFPSLCLHDKDDPTWHARSLKDDLAAGFSALRKIDNIAKEFGNPPIFITGGNHEDRYNKWMASDHRLLTSNFPQTIEEVVQQKAPHVDYIPFQQPLIVEGLTFCHYFVSGVMNRAHTGERPALSMLRQHHCSVIMGHKHTLDFAEHTRPDGSKLYAFVCGSFVDPANPFSFAGAGRKLWWHGCHLLHIYKDGEFDVESISLDRMK